jgi:hypothetical protein
MGSSLYGRLLEAAAADLEAGGSLLRLVWPYRDEPGRLALPLRLLARLHRLVLQGELPRLARHYPSVGGTAGTEDAWPAFRRACEERLPELQAALGRPCQTNEVGRCAALMGGFALVTGETGLPLRLLEVGASAGLNLRWDHYRGASWLPALLEEPPPEVGPVEVVERLGCDVDPVDPTSQDGELTLKSFVWADMVDRLRMLEDAIQVCREVPVTVDRADGGDWLPERLAEPCRGVATVVFHSVVVQYVSDRSLARMGTALQRAAAAATAEAPLAWLRLEPGQGRFEVRLSLWPGGDDRLLATATGHGREVRWLG